MQNQFRTEQITSAIIPFSYEKHEVRTIKDTEGNPWFVAKDVCDILDHSNPSMAIEMLDEDERSKQSLGRQGETWVISESGLYALIFRSNKREAKNFRRWVTSEVIPQIRRTGAYHAPGSYPAFLVDTIRRLVPLIYCEQQHDATLGVKQLFLFVQSKISALWGRYSKEPEMTIMWLFAPLRRVFFLEVQHV